jgi:hypothetical protein
MSELEVAEIPWGAHGAPYTGEALELRVLFESSTQLRVVATRFEYEVLPVN